MGRLSSLLPLQKPQQTKLLIVYSVHYLFPELNFTIVRKDSSLQSVWGALHNAPLAPPLTAIWVWEFCRKDMMPTRWLTCYIIQWQHLSQEEGGDVCTNYPKQPLSSQEYKLRPKKKKIPPFTPMYILKAIQLFHLKHRWFINYF